MGRLDFLNNPTEKLMTAAKECYTKATKPEEVKYYRGRAIALAAMPVSIGESIFKTLGSIVYTGLYFGTACYKFQDFREYQLSARLSWEKATTACLVGFNDPERMIDLAHTVRDQSFVARNILAKASKFTKSDNPFEASILSRVTHLVTLPCAVIETAARVFEVAAKRIVYHVSYGKLCEFQTTLNAQFKLKASVDAIFQSTYQLVFNSPAVAA